MFEIKNPNLPENLKNRIDRIIKNDVNYHVEKIDALRIDLEFVGETEKAFVQNDIDWNAIELAKYLNQVNVLQARLYALENVNSESIPMPTDELENAKTVLRLVA